MNVPYNKSMPQNTHVVPSNSSIRGHPVSRAKGSEVSFCRCPNDRLEL